MSFEAGMDDGNEQEMLEEMMSTLSSGDNDGGSSERGMGSPEFRTPTLATSSRGRKRKPMFDEAFDYCTSTPKRGRPKGTTAAVLAARPPKPPPPERRSRQSEAGPRGDFDPSGLVTPLRTGSKNINALVDKWINDYDSAPDRAISQFLQLMISACGCNGLINPNMIHNVDFRQIIAKLSDEFDEDAGSDYPLVLTTPQWKRFRTNFGEFIMLFVNKCKASILFDVTLMDSLIQLLTGLADSPIRAFRHTTTFAAMKLSSAIVDVVVELVGLQEKNTIQVETEKAKLMQMGGPNERLDILLRARADLDAKVDELSAMIQYLFKTVFVHRYRDVVPDIRCICIAELGAWLRVYPAYFLDDSYLKYIGWSLYDKFHEVRLKCLQALLPLYEPLEFVSRLELFTSKFKDRVVGMVMDVEVDVAIKACQLVTHVYRAFPAILEIKDCIPIFELAYHTNRALATAAGEFLNTKVFNLAAIEAQQLQLMPHLQQQTGGSNSIQRSARRQLLLDLVAFFVESEMHSHAAYLVDSLIETGPVLKDWGSMAEMLLQDESENYDTELIEIMSCAVKQAATGDFPVGRVLIRRGAPPAKDLKALAEECTRISEVFIPTLPRMMMKFIADQGKIANLTQIPMFFQLEMYPAGRLGLHLDELMQTLERIVEQHTDDEILRNVASIVHYLGTNLWVAQQTEAIRLRIIDGVSMQLRHGMERFMQMDENEQLDDEDEAALLASYRKMVAFSAVFDIRKWDVWDAVVLLLDNNQRFNSADLAEKAVTLLHQNLTWELKRTVMDGDYDDASLKRLMKRRDQFLQTTNAIIKNGAAGVENAYLCLCDMLVLFNWKLAADGDPDNELFQALPARPSSELSLRIQAFMLDNVFVGEENENYRKLDQSMQIQLMYKRRNLLGQYCKLIIHGVLPVLDGAAPILQHYARFYNDYGDLLKMLLHKCRELDKMAATKALIKALHSTYDELRETVGHDTDGVVDPASDEFGALKELAKRFAWSFGPDSVRNRDAVALVHKEGISYALELDDYQRTRRPTTKPKSLPFLEALIEFSAKLVRQDKQAVLRYLEKHCPPGVAETVVDDPAWAPYNLYKNSLIAKTADNANNKAAAAAAAAGAEQAN